MKILKFGFYLFLSISLSIGLLSFCGATCLASTQACHKVEEPVVPPCHDMPAQDMPKCQCQHFGLSAVKPDYQNGINLPEVKPGFDVQVVKGFHFSIRPDSIEVLCLNLGPPGHTPAALLTYLSYSEHSPPYFA